MNSVYINIFISHSWAYSDHYNTLAKWIFGGDWKTLDGPILFRDYSIPKDNPIHNANSAEQLRTAIFGEISKSHIVVIPTGMYAHHSKWIQKEIDGAATYRKPILAVNPWGAQKTSSVVQASAAATVGWSSQSVMDKIWELYIQA